MPPVWEVCGLLPFFPMAPTWKAQMKPWAHFVLSPGHSERGCLEEGVHYTGLPAVSEHMFKAPDCSFSLSVGGLGASVTWLCIPLPSPTSPASWASISSAT